MTEERNSGRASGSGEYGADLWVEAMVSKGLKWVQSWRAEGQTGGGEQGQAMSPRGRKVDDRRSSLFGNPVREGRDGDDGKQKAIFVRCCSPNVSFHSQFLWAPERKDDICSRGSLDTLASFDF